MMNDTDLDPTASSVAYAWFASVINITPHVPLLQALRRYVRLRPENVLAFFRPHCQRTGMSCSALTSTICLSIHFWSHSFRQLRLVDHNRLIQRFGILPLPLPSTPSLTITWIRDSTRIPLSQGLSEFLPVDAHSSYQCILSTQLLQNSRSLPNSQHTFSAASSSIPSD